MLGLERLSLAELQAFKAIIEGNMPPEAQIDAAAARVKVQRAILADALARQPALPAMDASAIWASARSLARAFMHLLPDDQRQLRAALDAAIAEKQT